MRSRQKPILTRAPYSGFEAPSVFAPGAPRILIQKRGALGDILMATPLLAALTQAYPDAAITWLAAEDTFELLAARPDLEELIVWDDAYWKRLRRQGQLGYLRARTRFWRGLRARRYDMLISLEGHEMRWLPWVTGAPRRIGLWARGIAALRYQRVSGTYQSVVHALGLPAVPPIPTLPLLPEDFAAIDSWLAEGEAGNRNGPLVVVHPFTNWVTKTWFPERFAAVMDRLAEAHPVRLVLTGSPGQRGAAARIAALCRRAAPRVAAGRTAHIRHLGALIARADLVLTGDTSAMHIAGAVGTPSVALFGATGLDLVPPPPARCLPLVEHPPCGPCLQSECGNIESPLLCLRSLTVDRVMQAVDTLLKETHERSSLAEL